MIALFIGHQAATGNDGIANGIIRRVIADPDKNPFSGWRVAARALSDIHRQLRKPEVVDATTKRLLEVMAADAEPKIRAEAGEILGRLGDSRDLKAFVPVEGGRYKLSLGETDIQPFEIGKYPVTNSSYKEFIDAGGYDQTDYWTPEGRKWLEYKNATLPELWYDRDWNCPNAPVVGVCWYEAVAFIQWLNETRDDGKRYFLADENQWEAAAAGKEGRGYPWGNDWAENRCNSEESEIKKTSAAGIFSGGDTPEGVSDMAGNVWEWTTSNYHTKETFTDFAFQEDMEELWEQWRRAEGDEKKGIEKRLIGKADERDRPLPVLRGGSWDIPRYFARCACRYRDYPSTRDFAAGFRCART
jgi:formylglycine-generating enzyme required for sulfatase activity